MTLTASDFRRDDGEETLEDVFDRVNGADESVQLKARLTYLMPLPVEGGEAGLSLLTHVPSNIQNPILPLSWSGGDSGNGFFPRDPGAPPTVSTQEDVDLLLEGTRSLQVKVVAE